MNKNNKNSNKVIGIGLHKTGTSTLGDLLLTLGYDVVGARLDLSESLAEGNKKPAIELAAHFPALQDIPWALLYKELDEAFPGSKFILTERDENKWMNSVLNHFGDRYWVMHEWIYGVETAAGNEERYREVYRNHNRQVREYFKDRPDDLLIMNFENGDGWEKLCPFLGVDVPGQKVPHANKGRHSFTLKDHAKYIIRSMLPSPIRKFRVSMLEQLGLHKGRNRFNNAHVNQHYRGKVLSRKQ